jgi:hypothetical protein
VKGEFTDNDLERAAKPTNGSALHQLMDSYTRQCAEQEFNRRLRRSEMNHS